MDTTKDYYATLGVLPSAEDFVIRAVHKALAQRYHPDRFCGAIEDAHLRMAEINEAYSILSDPAARKRYDDLRSSTAQAADPYFGRSASEAPPMYDPLEEDWSVASKYYPDLPGLESRLANINWRLAYSYRAYLIEAKEFEARKKIADAMERQFLHLYFGNNEQVVRFARTLIELRNKPAALALNKAVRVLGNHVDARVIKQIRAEFGLAEKAPVNTACPYCGGIIFELADYCIHCGRHLE